MSLGLLISFPMAMFVAVSLFIAFLYHSVPVLTWVVVSLSVGISLLFMAASTRHTRDGPKFWFNLGALCFLATAAAAAAGLFNWYRNTNQYWAYEGQRFYSNVIPNSPALSHLDAGKVVFTEDARLDFQRSVGHRVGTKMFCVVPILGSMSPPAEIQYWAAGVDCCGGQGGNFTCNDALVRKVHSGLVYLQADEAARFQRATREAGTRHGLVASQDSLFLQWVEDPDEAARSYWRAGVTFLVGNVIVYLVLSIVAGVMLHWGRRVQKSKLDERRFA